MKTHRGSGSRVILLLLVLCVLCFVLFFVLLDRHQEAQQADGAALPATALPTAAASTATTDGTSSAAVDETTQSPGQLARRYLNARDYDALEALYARLAKGPFHIEDRWPDIMGYFDGLELRRTQPDTEWVKRGEAIEAWCAARPTSIPARLALAEFHNNYAWKARGTSYASEVSRSQWRLFESRREKALGILRGTDADAGKNSEEVQSSFYGRYLVVRILAPDGPTFREARSIAETLTAEEPGFYPAYSLVSNYLLPRWHGRPGDLTRHAEAGARRVANATGDGLAGDILYATLLVWAAEKDGEDFVRYHSPDYARIVRGFGALQERRPQRRIGNLAAFCQIAGRMEDWPRVRQLLAQMGPPLSFSEIGGRRFYAEMVRKSGLHTELEAINSLEWQGRLEDAATRYEQLGGGPTCNRWLTRFHLAHGDAARYAASDGAVDLSLSFREIPSFGTLIEQCHVSLALRDLQRTHDIAFRYDKYRATTPVARVAQYEVALHRGDAAAVAGAREALLALDLPDLKTWPLARDLLAGKRTPASVLSDGFDWLSERDALDTVFACALRCYELGDPDAARRFLSAAITANMAPLNADARLRALLFHPPGSSAAGPGREAELILFASLRGPSGQL